MKNFSGSKQKKSSNRYKTDSFSNLSQSTTVEITKKTIEAEQINRYEPNSIKANKYSFNLPYSIEISEIISLLTTKFSQQIIHVEEDHSGGKLIINGLRNNNGMKKFMMNVLDCVGLCCIKYSLKEGSLSQTYNIVYVQIKKQILNNRCILNIEHQHKDNINNKQFRNEFINKIQEELKKLDISHENHEETQNISRYLNSESLFLQEIQIKQKIFNIFIYQKQKKWERFRRLFTKSLQNIKDKIQDYKKQSDSTAKKNKKNPSTLIQAIIFQSQSLFRVLVNYYEKQAQNQNQLILFSTLLSSPIQKQFTLYCIEQIISMQFYQDIFLEYLQTIKQQCILFNKNTKQINQNMSNDSYFDYLELRDKFRLTQLKHAYHPSIQLLKNIVNSSYPRELLLYVQKVFSSVKIDCLKESKGKTQLSSMDDLLPVMIFVTARAEIQNFPAYVKMVDDYIRLKNVFELEERIITTLYVAVEDITKKWKN